MTRQPAPEEAKTIASLKRLAKTWPQSLSLVSIDGIPNDGGAW